MFWCAYISAKLLFLPCIFPHQFEKDKEKMFSKCRTRPSRSQPRWRQGQLPCQPSFLWGLQCLVCTSRPSTPMSRLNWGQVDYSSLVGMSPKASSCSVSALVSLSLSLSRCLCLSVCLSLCLSLSLFCPLFLCLFSLYCLFVYFFLFLSFLSVLLFFFVFFSFPLISFQLVALSSGEQTDVTFRTVIGIKVICTIMGNKQDPLTHSLTHISSQWISQSVCQSVRWDYSNYLINDWIRGCKLAGMRCYCVYTSFDFPVSVWFNDREITKNLR